VAICALPRSARIAAVVVLGGFLEVAFVVVGGRAEAEGEAGGGDVVEAVGGPGFQSAVAALFMGAVAEGIVGPAAVGPEVRLTRDGTVRGIEPVGSGCAVAGCGRGCCAPDEKTRACGRVPGALPEQVVIVVETGAFVSAVAGA
jgi:hypothetical protein